MPDPLAHSISEVTKISGLGRSFIYQEIRAGHLVARKAGGRTLVLHSDLLEYLRHLPSRRQSTDELVSEAV